MKLHRTLAINGSDLPISTHDVRLNLFTPGRAAFNVTASETLSGIVKFSLGYDPAQMHLAFYGYVENSYQVDARQQRIFCRELPASLNRLLPLSLRNVTLRQVLAAISAETGLDFVTPEQQYADTKAPAFYCLGTGYYCMDSLAQVFRIPQFLWQQQGNGQVYVGSWQHSYWFGRAVEIPSKAQDQMGVANTARIPVVPRMRPGVQLTSGHFVNQVHMDGVHMNVGWNKNPWGTRWTNRSSV